MADENAGENIEVRLEGEDHGQPANESPAKPENDASIQAAAAEAERARQEAAYWKSIRDQEQLRNTELTIQSEVGAAESQYRQALESGDASLAAQAARRMTTATAVQLEIEKHKQQASAASAQPVHTDPLEKYVQGRPAQTQQWLREHRDWVLDPTKNAELTRAHHHAVGSGLTPDSDAYLRHVEGRIGLKREPDVKYQRNIPGFNPSDPATHIQGNKVVLTKGEAERATNGDIVWNEADFRAGRIKDRNMIGREIGLQEYGRRKKIMLAQGMYNRLG